MKSINQMTQSLTERLASVLQEVPIDSNIVIKSSNHILKVELNIKSDNVKPVLEAQVLIRLFVVQVNMSGIDRVEFRIKLTKLENKVLIHNSLVVDDILGNIFNQL